MDSKLSRLVQAGSCLLCAVLVSRYWLQLDGSEFSGGTVTGPVLNMAGIGMLVFLVALPMAFFLRRRISGAVTIIASLLCLPLYLYFTLPGPFRWVFRGEYKVPLQANVVFEKWSIICILALSIAAILGSRGLWQHSGGHTPRA
jgi:hypothetical protein